MPLDFMYCLCNGSASFVASPLACGSRPGRRMYIPHALVFYEAIMRNLSPGEGGRQSLPVLHTTLPSSNHSKVYYRRLENSCSIDRLS